MNYSYNNDRLKKETYNDKISLQDCDKRSIHNQDPMDLQNYHHDTGKFLRKRLVQRTKDTSFLASSHKNEFLQYHHSTNHNNNSFPNNILTKRTLQQHLLYRPTSFFGRLRWNQPQIQAALRQEALLAEQENNYQEDSDFTTSFNDKNDSSSSSDVMSRTILSKGRQQCFNKNDKTSSFILKQHNNNKKKVSFTTKDVSLSSSEIESDYNDELDAVSSNNSYLTHSDLSDDDNNISSESFSIDSCSILDSPSNRHVSFENVFVKDKVSAISHYKKPFIREAVSHGSEIKNRNGHTQKKKKKKNFQTKQNSNQSYLIQQQQQQQQHVSFKGIPEYQKESSDDDYDNFTDSSNDNTNDDTFELDSFKENNDGKGHSLKSSPSWLDPSESFDHVVNSYVQKHIQINSMHSTVGPQTTTTPNPSNIRFDLTPPTSDTLKEDSILVPDNVISLSSDDDDDDQDSLNDSTFSLCSEFTLPTTTAVPENMADVDNNMVDGTLQNSTATAAAVASMLHCKSPFAGSTLGGSENINASQTPSKSTGLSMRFIDVVSSSQLKPFSVIYSSNNESLPIGLRIPNYVIYQMAQGIQLCVTTEVIRRFTETFDYFGIPFLMGTTETKIKLLCGLLFTSVLSRIIYSFVAGTIEQPYFSLFTVPLIIFSTLFCYISLKLASSILLVLFYCCILLDLSILGLIVVHVAHDFSFETVRGMDSIVSVFALVFLIISLISTALLLIVAPASWYSVYCDVEKSLSLMPVEKFHEKIDANPFLTWYFNIPSARHRIK